MLNKNNRKLFNSIINRLDILDSDVLIYSVLSLYSHIADTVIVAESLNCRSQEDLELIDFLYAENDKLKSELDNDKLND